MAASDGRFLWGYDKMANSTADISTPTVKGDYVFGSTAYGGGSALVKLSKDGDGVKAEEVYFLKPKDYSNHHGGTVLVGDYLYGGNGQNNGKPTCLDFLTGKSKWKDQATAPAADRRPCSTPTESSTFAIRTAPWRSSRPIRTNTS